MSLDVTLYVNVDTGGEPVSHVCFEANITHNLNKMAEVAGVYRACWRPEELPEVRCAADLIPLLSAGIVRLQEAPQEMQKHDAPNGWGTYRQFLPWLIEYRDACVRYPKALIRVSR